jgi:hypothetical protein
MFDNAKWIWKSKEAGKDEYVLFHFDLVYTGGEALMRLSADSDYNLLVNGKMVSFGQYHEYEETAVYDEIDLKDFLNSGNNRIEILVWYYGESNSSYSLGTAGLLFEVLVGGKQVAKSDENVLSAYEPHYQKGYCKKITYQLGYSYFYDARKDSLPDFSKSVVVEKPYPVCVRPIKKLVLGESVVGKLHRADEKRKYIFDLGQEIVGFLSFSVFCEKESKLTISYGEHLLNDEICRLIEDRDFSFTYYAKEGENSFYNAFRRLGCRYIAIESDIPFEVNKMEILPTDYPLTEVPFDAGEPRRQRIYDTAIRTLRACAHEHYEDCPWREQGLFTMDSRNQMLCGYYAFKEYDFARASLSLYANSKLTFGLLPMCVPCDFALTIPSFSLHYVCQVCEYLEYSGDANFVRSIYPRLQELFQTFNKRMRNGLLLEFEEEDCWNFYEWKEGLSYDGKNKCNLILNTLYLKALQSMSVIASVLKKEDCYSDSAKEIKKQIFDYFYDKNQGLFVLGKEDPIVTELGNYLCVLTDIVTGDNAKAVVERLNKNTERITLTLSMLCFKYDALLKVDKARYTSEILRDIDERWGKMLDAGATTFWETEEGYKDFNGAGSLCHGWSAIPVYYYHILLDKNKTFND